MKDDCQPAIVVIDRASAAFRRIAIACRRLDRRHNQGPKSWPFFPPIECVIFGIATGVAVGVTLGLWLDPALGDSIVRFLRGLLSS